MCTWTCLEPHVICGTCICVLVFSAVKQLFVDPHLHDPCFRPAEVLDLDSLPNVNVNRACTMTISTTNGAV